MTLALAGKTRRRRTVLVLAALIAILISMAGGASLYRGDGARADQPAVTGAIATTNFAGTVQNQNQFANKCDVYLHAAANGPQLGPDSSGTVKWYIRVTNPNGDRVLTPTPGYIIVAVTDGQFVGPNGTVPLCENGTVQYGDTDNPGGVYKAWASISPNFENEFSKTDNFKVVGETPADQQVTFIKYICPTEADIPASPDGGSVLTDEAGGCTRAVDPWTFNLGSTSGASDLGTATTGSNGIATITLTGDQLTEALKPYVVGGPYDGLWVSEVTQSGFTFGSLRCYADHFNGAPDNDELLNIPTAGTAGVMCIAYNVGEQVVEEGKIQVHKFLWDPTKKNGEGDWRPNVQGGNRELDFEFTLNEIAGSSFEDIAQGSAGAGYTAPTGNYTLSEKLPAPGGYTFVAFFNSGNNGTQCLNPGNAPTDPSDTGPNSVNVTVEANKTTHVCAYDAPAPVAPTGTIRIIKVDETLPAEPANKTWHFTATNGVASQQITSSGQVSIPNVPFGTYAVTETEAHLANTCPALPNVNQQGYFTTVAAPGDNVIDTADEEIVWTFTNAPCPSERAAPNLTVQKVIDYNGNGVMDGADYLANGWTINATCATASKVTGSDGTGTVKFNATTQGTCTVSETAKSGYSAAVKWAKTDGAVTTSGTGDSVTVTQNVNETNVVTFFNQPLGAIRVTKTTVTSHNNGADQPAPQDDDGWTITLTSTACVVSRTAVTNNQGVALFEDLPICSDYVVAENLALPGADGYVPVGASSIANQTPAIPATEVGFTNRKATFDPFVVPTPTPVVPTPVPPTPVPPTPVPPTPVPPTVVPPTAVAPATPPVDAVAGEKAPGETPIAPSAGSGGPTGEGSPAPLFALAGLLITAGGMAGLAAARRKLHN